jgi:hypothetical protein
MVPIPVAAGLVFCDLIIIEEKTRRISLINTFGRLAESDFPFTPRFWVYAPLSDGLGDGVVQLRVTEVGTDKEIYDLQRAIRFSRRMLQVNALFRIHDCTFPRPGVYFFNLLVDGEWVTHRRLRVVQQEEDS